MSAVGRLSLAVFALTVLAAVAWPAQDFKIVAHSSITTRMLSRVEVSHLFMKKNIKWPDGSLVVPVDLPVGSTTRAVFSRAVHGKSTAAVDAFWQRQIFMGRGLPPITKSNDADVVDYVRSTPGAVGYVSAGTPAAGLRTIRVQ